MEALWDNGEMSGNQLYDQLGEKLGIHHNTLLTVLERLIMKGLVEKRKVKRFNLYSPLLSRDEFGGEVAGSLMSELLEVSAYGTMAALVDNASGDPEKLEELKRLIEEAEKKSEKH